MPTALRISARYGPEAALIAESFSPRLRYSGTSTGYQLASIIAGGPAPIIATWTSGLHPPQPLCGSRRARDPEREWVIGPAALEKEREPPRRRRGRAMAYSTSEYRGSAARHSASDSPISLRTMFVSVDALFAAERTGDGRYFRVVAIIADSHRHSAGEIDTLDVLHPSIAWARKTGSYCSSPI
jgi:hypothetical protein